VCVCVFFFWGEGVFVCMCCTFFTNSRSWKWRVIVWKLIIVCCIGCSATGFSLRYRNVRDSPSSFLSLPFFHLSVQRVVFKHVIKGTNPSLCFSVSLSLSLFVTFFSLKVHDLGATHKSKLPPSVSILQIFIYRNIFLPHWFPTCSEILKISFTFTRKRN